MSITYTYNVIGTTEKLGGNGEILHVHIDLVGTDSNEKKASRQFATTLNSLAHTDASFIASPTDEQKITWAKAQWGIEDTGVTTLTKFEELIKNEIETGYA